MSKKYDIDKNDNDLTFKSVLGGIWKFLMGLIKVLQGITGVIFLILLIMALILLSSANFDGPFGGKSSKEEVVIEDGSALLINPAGVLKEFVRDEQEFEDIIKQALEVEDQVLEVSAHEMIKAINIAKDDPKIEYIVLVIQDLFISDYSLNLAFDVADALSEFKSTGKKIYAVGDYFTQQQYLIASVADEIWIDPLGSVLMTGYGRYRIYRKAFVDRHEITQNIFKVGKFKSALETVIRDDMSEEAKEANMAYLESMWQRYTDRVESERGLEKGSLQANLDDYANIFKESGSDFSQFAVNLGLVDKLMKREERLYRLIEIIGDKSSDGKKHKKDKKHKNKDDNKKAKAKMNMDVADASASGEALEESSHHNIDFASLNEKYESDDVYKHVTWRDYLDENSEEANFIIDGNMSDGDHKKIMIVNVDGVIIDGDYEKGYAASNPIVESLIEARKDDDVAAVVLRVNSPGGSVTASTEISREIELLTKVKPVVASMGSLAASGGYWVSAKTDYIMSAPDTITGSIGIFGYIETFEKPLKKHLNMNADGVGTTKLSSIVSAPYNPLDDDFKSLFQSMVEQGYDDFIDLVATGRNLEEDYVREIAEGRVWVGKKALELKLVDELGDLKAAIKKAAELANLSEFKVEYPTKELTDIQKLLKEFTNMNIGDEVKNISDPRLKYFNNSILDVLETEYKKELNRKVEFSDPFGVYAICMECKID